MVDPALDDLVGLGRDVARGAAALVRWRSELRLDPESQPDFDPFEDVRHVTAKSTWERLGELTVSAVDAPLREGLRRWVPALLQARIEGPDDLAWAREAARPRGRYEGEHPRRVSWREAWRGAVAAKSPAEARLWLDAAADAAAALVDVAQLRAVRRVEVARRLGLAHPWQCVTPIDASRLRASAASFLDRTEDLSVAVWREALGGRVDAPSVIHSSVARERGEGWPARLTPRWLKETFRANTRDLPIHIEALPATVGAASFARALSAFGFALRLALVDPSLPFVMGHDPAFVSAHRLGSVFGALGADPEFYIRALGVGRRAALAQARDLARAVLFEARLRAARVLLGDDVSPGRSVFEHIGSRLFGSPIDGRFFRVWPAARDDEPARWIGLIRAPSYLRVLRESFDTDWFLNPRAWSYLRSQGAGPAYEPALVDAESLEPEGRSLALALEDALG